jgi:peptidoglycan/LPS O-acetylase OafA/YrhL
MIVQEANPRSAGFDYVPTLDGWRALSVIAVISYHCLHNGLDPGSIWSRLALRGQVGVDVFFAISGFLICGKLLEELTDRKTISLKNFYLRRCFRILPPIWGYLATLATLTAIGWVKTRSWEFGSTLLFVRNYFPLFHKGEVFGAYTAQFWSLAVEEHFYLLCPITMLLVGPKICRIRRAGLALALGLFAWRTIDAAHGWLIPFGVDVHSKTDTRLDALLWGCLAATIYPYVCARVNASTFRGKLWLPISLVAVLVILPSDLVADSLIKAALFPALIMSTAIAPESVLGRFLELPVMKWMGRLSYSMYIWQQLAIFPVGLSRSPLRYMQHFPFNISLIFIIACCSYYLLERPMIRIGHKLTRRISAGPMANSALRERASVVYHDAVLALCSRRKIASPQS